MRSLLVLSIILIPCLAGGWTFIGPNGQYMNGTETPEEVRARDAARQQALDEYTDAIELQYNKTQEKRPEPDRTQEEFTQRNQSQQIIIYGTRPGGHLRHEYRGITGFRSPAEKRRYEEELRRLQEELKKAKAKPNPNGATIEEMRKARGAAE